MTRCLLAALVLAVALAGCQWVVPPPHRVFCTNEPVVRHGHVVDRIECVSQGWSGPR